MRPIDADAMAKEFECLANSGLIWEEMCAFKEAAEMVRKQPTIDPESLRPKGRWEKCWQEKSRHYFRCSNCHTAYMNGVSGAIGPEYGSRAWNYCPHCGAKMGDGGIT